MAQFADFHLGSTLQNTASSPSISGGINLNAAGLTVFTGTTERGAVRSTENWVFSPWISVASN